MCNNCAHRCMPRQSLMMEAKRELRLPTNEFQRVTPNRFPCLRPVNGVRLVGFRRRARGAWWEERLGAHKMAREAMKARTEREVPEEQKSPEERMG